MPLIRFKPLVAVLAALTAASAVGGAAIYYMHVSVLNTLAEPPSIGESLDKVRYMEYTIRIGGDEYLVKIYNEPGSRSGRAEIYRGGELLYTVNYRYGENSLVSAEMVKGGEAETLDPVEYEEQFITSVKVTVTPAGNIEAEPFPGIAPLQAVFYITRAMGVNWDSFIRGTGPGVPVNINVDFRGVETPLGSSRGILVSIVPQNPALAASVWLKGPFTFELGKAGDLIVATRIVYDVALEQGGQGIIIELRGLELA